MDALILLVAQSLAGWLVGHFATRLYRLGRRWLRLALRSLGNPTPPMAPAV